MDAGPIFDALPAINHIFTTAAIGCVLSTYFLHRRPAAYRLILSVGIAFGLSSLVIAITAALLSPFPHPAIRLLAINMLLWSSPLAVVLLAILARIKRLTRMRLWSTVVLACVIVDWAGICALISALS